MAMELPGRNETGRGRTVGIAAGSGAGARWMEFQWHATQTLALPMVDWCDSTPVEHRWANGVTTESQSHAEASTVAPNRCHVPSGCSMLPVYQSMQPLRAALGRPRMVAPRLEASLVQGDGYLGA